MVAEDLNVFDLPHNHMKRLVGEIEKQVKSISTHRISVAWLTLKCAFVRMYFNFRCWQQTLVMKSRITIY